MLEIPMIFKSATANGFASRLLLSQSEEKIQGINRHSASEFAFWFRTSREFVDSALK